ncbi:hypothetical protein CFSAN002368_02012 [Clostridium botulinum A1 str. CFSAN002368]|nr:hypothetical protein CFSAN002368_02012 [Clostridium botulinum A1 str. CFSAN002368]
MSIDGIVLAGGLSSRPGRYKLTLNIQGKTVIERCIESMYDICSNVIVVGGYNYNLLQDILKPYSKVKMILNENYLEGMFSSVKKGLYQVKGDKFFNSSGLSTNKKDTYIKMLSTNSDIVIPTYKNIKGHPVLIKRRIINNILSEEYISLREFINKHGFSTLCIEDEGVLLDIDTDQDYIDILNRAKFY